MSAGRQPFVPSEGRAPLPGSLPHSTGRPPHPGGQQTLPTVPPAPPHPPGPGPHAETPPRPAPPAAPPAPPGPPGSPAPTTVAAGTVGLTKVYGSGQTAVRALDNVNVQIGAGQFTTIMGPSGSGKSTLMHCLAGLDAATSGSIFLGNTEITRLSDRQLTVLRRDRVGFVFQSFNLLPTLTAEQNIVLPLELAGKKPDRQWLDRLIGVLGIGDRLKHRPSEMSGGQQQRVAVARALVSRPEVVFADEPTGNLDSRSGAEVLAFLRDSVRTLGQTVVMVTHDPIAASYSDRAILLADGRPVGELWQPNPESVLDAIRRLGG